MIKVQDLSKQYRSGRGVVQALQRVSFTIPAGAKVALFGKSGSGKTTLLYCLAGLEKPQAGTVHCFGLEVSAASQRQLGRFQRQHLGFVFQASNLFSHLTVKENISFPLALLGWQKTAILKRVADMLGRIGLATAANALPGELSGGEMQRVSVARALVHSPRLLLADEPTASLDSETGRDLVALMFALGSQTGCTIIMATHDPEIINLADQPLTILDGRVESETP